MASTVTELYTMLHCCVHNEALAWLALATVVTFSNGKLLTVALHETAAQHAFALDGHQGVYQPTVDVCS